MERRTLLGLARDAVRTIRRFGLWVGYLCTVDVLGKLAAFDAEYARLSQPLQRSLAAKESLN
jgi:hypothetical protein